jgi:hypothetical protein
MYCRLNLFIFFLFAVFCSQAQSLDSLLHPQNVKKISGKLLQTNHIVLKKNQLLSLDTISVRENELHLFDRQGNKILYAQLDQKDSAYQFYNYTYNQLNQKIEQAQTFNYYFYKGKNTYTYNSDGTLRQMKQLDYRDSIYRTTNYSYVNGKIKEERTYNASNLLIIHRQSFYDPQGDLTYFVNNSTSVSYNNNLPFSIKQYFDDNHHMIRREYFDEYNNLKIYWLYTYDENGNKLSEKQFNSKDQIVGSTYYVYNKKNLVTEIRQYDANTGKRTKMNYQYNKNNNYSHLKIYLDNSKKPEYYKDCYYDQHGNWILWIEKDKHKKVLAVGNRSIEYYE